MCTRGKRTQISIWCQIESVENEFVVFSRMIHVVVATNGLGSFLRVIKIYQTILWPFSLTDHMHLWTYNIDEEDDKKTAKVHPVSVHDKVISCHL